MIEQLSAKVPTPEKTYIGNDGLLYCAKCGEPLETIIVIRNKGKRKVRCICSCIEADKRNAAEQEKHENHERNRKDCFTGLKLHNSTFANSEKNENLKIGINYVDNWKIFKKQGKGLLLYGPVGTGKSHLAACIANALIDEGERVYMRNFATVANTLFGAEDKQGYINSLCRAGLLIIDDLGAERNSEYMHENIFNVIEARINTGLPLIVTTNLSGNDMRNAQNVWERRIYDRVYGNCHPVEIKGKSMRIRNASDEYAETQTMLMKEITR